MCVCVCMCERASPAGVDASVLSAHVFFFALALSRFIFIGIVVCFIL